MPLPVIVQQILVYIALTLVAYALTPKPRAQKPQPGQAEIPKAQEGGPIPVVFGRCCIKESNVLATCDASTRAIRTKSGK